jgi:hypothetical protein
MTPHTIQFSGTGGTWVMRITADRRIEVNEDVEVTDAAQKVLDALQHLLKPAPVQEPVAWLMYKGEHKESFWLDKGDAYNFEMTPEHRWEPLYLKP